MFDEEKASLSDIIVDGRTPNLANVMRVRKKYVRSGPGASAREATGGAEAVRDAVRTDEALRETVAALPDAFETADEAAPQSSLTAKLLEARKTRPSNTPPVQDTAATSTAPSPERPSSMSTTAQGKQRAAEPVVQASPSSPLTPRRKRQTFEDSSETEEESQGMSSPFHFVYFMTHAPSKHYRLRSIHSRACAASYPCQTGRMSAGATGRTQQTRDRARRRLSPHHPPLHASPARQARADPSGVRRNPRHPRAILRHTGERIAWWALQLALRRSGRASERTRRTPAQRGVRRTTPCTRGAGDMRRRKSKCAHRVCGRRSLANL